ncbi:MAG: hypothetical protein HY595_04060 [Candidatus Omnitrophica bacterium]|nr:hypothetical protein [Candidatus Omnitrophota bacterium]
METPLSLIVVLLIATLTFFGVSFVGAVYTNVTAYRLKRHLAALGKDDYVSTAGLFGSLASLYTHTDDEEELGYKKALRLSIKITKFAMKGVGIGLLFLVIVCLVVR